MSKPYFSLDGLAFQTPGTDIEKEINMRAAVNVLRRYAKGGDRDGVMTALAYIEDHHAKTERFCDDIRATLLLDDCQDSERIQAMVTLALNNIIRRLTGVPV